MFATGSGTNGSTRGRLRGVRLAGVRLLFAVVLAAPFIGIGHASHWSIAEHAAPAGVDEALVAPCPHCELAAAMPCETIPSISRSAADVSWTAPRAQAAQPAPIHRLARDDARPRAPPTPA